MSKKETEKEGPYSGFIDEGYSPTNNDIVCDFYLEPAGDLDVLEGAQRIAAESSIGTWTKVKTSSEINWDELKAKVFEIDGNNVKVAYPTELFELGSIPQLTSSVAGNIFGMKDLKNLRLNNIHFPKKYVKSFKGPKYGIKGIRKILGVKDRPLLGTIVKPKVGLSSEDHSDVAYDAWIGGLDIVKDDENLTSQNFNPFKKRVKKTLEKRKKAEDETGDTKIYMPNITAETDDMLKRANFVKEHGGRYIMVDVITSGFAALQTVRNKNPDMVIHAHRAMHAAMTRKEKHGISMLTLAKLYRLIGVDQLHTGTVVGKMHGEKEDVVKIDEFMRDSLYGLKKTFPVASGGLHPGLLPKLIDILGKNIIIQAGGGVHWNPRGTKYGAMGLRQALEAKIKGISLKEYAKDHRELKEAIDKFGVHGKE